MIGAKTTGSFDKTATFLKTMQSGDIFDHLDVYGRRGVDLLASATPYETGRTAQAWGYQVGHKKGKYSISWFNTHVENGVNIAVILQYGHGTGTGGYIRGRDYINPAMRPLFDKILDDVWRQVRNA